MEGFIKLHRKIMMSEIWYKSPWYLKIWIYILMEVFYKDWWKFATGEWYFEYQNIMTQCGVSKDIVKRCLLLLESHWQIHRQKQPRGVIIKVINYEKYQLNAPTVAPTVAPTNREEGRKKKEEYILELEQLLEYWNSKYKLKNRITDNLQNRYITKRKKYKKEDIEYAIWNYNKYIAENNWYNTRHWLYKFLQKNIFEDYLNKY